MVKHRLVDFFVQSDKCLYLFVSVDMYHYEKKSLYYLEILFGGIFTIMRKMIRRIDEFSIKNFVYFRLSSNLNNRPSALMTVLSIVHKMILYVFMQEFITLNSGLYKTLHKIDKENNSYREHQTGWFSLIIKFYYE